MYQSPEDALDPVIDWHRIGDTLRTLCRVSEATIRRWRRQPERMPAAAQVLARLLSSGHLGILWPAWHGYIIRDDTLAWWSGEYAIRPGQVSGYDWLERSLDRSHQEIRRLERLVKLDQVAAIRDDLAGLVERLDAIAGPARQRVR